MKAYLEPNEIDRLESATLNLRDRLLIRVLFHLGCRISEALGIQVDDVDIGQSSITIQHLKVRINLSCSKCGTRLGKRHTFCPGCGHKVKQASAKENEHRRVRTLPIDKETLNMLKGYIDKGGPVLKEGKRMLFGINRHRAWQIVTECAARAGLPKLVNPETGKVHNLSPHK